MLGFINAYIYLWKNSYFSKILPIPPKKAQKKKYWKSKRVEQAWFPTI